MGWGVRGREEGSEGRGSKLSLVKFVYLVGRHEALRNVSQDWLRK